jgi:ParB family chromosome partitioning protein
MKTTAKISSVSIKKINTRYSTMRLITPTQVEHMILSMKKNGQLQPLIIRQESEEYELIDGFKRYYAAQNLKLSSLEARILDVPAILGKAMILSYNKTSGSLVDYEEGLVIQNLKEEHMLSQKEISELLGHSTTWVCRRLSLVEKLEQGVRDTLRMGQITSGHARELVKLPRGNQQKFTTCIIDNNLTTWQTSKLIAVYLESGTKEEAKWLLADPLKAIGPPVVQKDIYDCRLGIHANRLLKTMELFINQSHIFIGQYASYHTGQLNTVENTILEPKLAIVIKKINTILLILNKNK